jgi:hypothetical protein
VNLTRLGSDERRMHHRYTEPSFEARISETPFVTQDWSLGGVLMRGLPRAVMELDSEREVSGQIDLGEGPGIVEFTGRIVRSDPEQGELAIAFAQLGEQQLDQFAKVFKTFRLTRSIH